MVSDDITRAWVWVCENWLPIDEADQTGTPIAYKETIKRAVEGIATSIEQIIARWILCIRKLLIW
jgi:hypothetical protein